MHLCTYALWTFRFFKIEGDDWGYEKWITVVISGNYTIIIPYIIYIIYNIYNIKLLSQKNEKHRCPKCISA